MVNEDGYSGENSLIRIHENQGGYLIRKLEPGFRAPSLGQKANEGLVITVNGDKLKVQYHVRHGD